MIKNVDASMFKRYEGGNYDVEILGQQVVRLRCIGESAVRLYGIPADGEAVLLARGEDLDFHAKVDGFLALQLRSDAAFSCRCVASETSEMVDSTPMVIAEERPVDPVRVAMAEEMRRLLAERESARPLSQEEIDEVIDDFLDPELEDDEEEIDEFSLLSAYQQEEMRRIDSEKAAAEENQRRYDEARLRQDSVEENPGEDVDNSGEPPAQRLANKKRPSKAVPAGSEKGEGGQNAVGTVHSST